MELQGKDAPGEAIACHHRNHPAQGEPQASLGILAGVPSHDNARPDRPSQATDADRNARSGKEEAKHDHRRSACITLPEQTQQEGTHNRDNEQAAKHDVDDTPPLHDI